MPPRRLCHGERLGQKVWPVHFLIKCDNVNNSRHQWRGEENPQPAKGADAGLLVVDQGVGLLFIGGGKVGSWGTLWNGQLQSSGSQHEGRENQLWRSFQIWAFQRRGDGVCLWWVPSAQRWASTTDSQLRWFCGKYSPSPLCGGWRVQRPWREPVHRVSRRSGCWIQYNSMWWCPSRTIHCSWRELLEIVLTNNLTQTFKENSQEISLEVLRSAQKYPENSM